MQAFMCLRGGSVRYLHGPRQMKRIIESDGHLKKKRRPKSWKLDSRIPRIVDAAAVPSIVEALKPHLRQKEVFESGPGAGLLSEALIDAGVRKLTLWEPAEVYWDRLEDLERGNKDVHLEKSNFFTAKAIGKSKHQPYLQGTDVPWHKAIQTQVLGAIHPKDTSIWTAKTAFAMARGAFPYHRGRAEFFLFVTGYEHQLMTDPDAAVGGSLGPTPRRTVNYELFYKIKTLHQVPVSVFGGDLVDGPVPKTATWDRDHLYLVRLTPRADLFQEVCEESLFPAFLVFCQQLYRIRRASLIPRLEQWCPGLGLVAIDLGYSMMDTVKQLQAQHLPVFFKELHKRDALGPFSADVFLQSAPEEPEESVSPPDSPTGSPASTSGALYTEDGTYETAGERGELFDTDAHLINSSNRANINDKLLKSAGEGPPDEWEAPGVDSSDALFHTDSTADDECTQAASPPKVLQQRSSRRQMADTILATERTSESHIGSRAACPDRQINESFSAQHDLFISDTQNDASVKEEDTVLGDVSCKKTPLEKLLPLESMKQLREESPADHTLRGSQSLLSGDKSTGEAEEREDMISHALFTTQSASFPGEEKPAPSSEILNETSHREPLAVTLNFEGHSSLQQVKSTAAQPPSEDQREFSSGQDFAAHSEAGTLGHVSPRQDSVEGVNNTADIDRGKPTADISEQNTAGKKTWWKKILGF